MQCRSTSNFLSIYSARRLHFHVDRVQTNMYIQRMASKTRPFSCYLADISRDAHHPHHRCFVEIILIRLISRGFPTHFIFQKKRSVITSILEKTSLYLLDLSKRFLCFRYGANTIHQACGPTTLRMHFIFARCVYLGNLGSLEILYDHCDSASVSTSHWMARCEILREIWTRSPLIGHLTILPSFLAPCALRLCDLDLYPASVKIALNSAYLLGFLSM
jgi:hypothetical protein